jgi:hypothetical protein
MHPTRRSSAEVKQQSRCSSKSRLCPCGCGEMVKIGEDIRFRCNCVSWSRAARNTPAAAARARSCRRMHQSTWCRADCRPRQQVIVAKFGDHLPFYRQAEIYAVKGANWIARRWVIGLAGLLPPHGDRRSHAKTPGRGGSSVHGRNRGAGGRSGTTHNQEGLLLGNGMR